MGEWGAVRRRLRCMWILSLALAAPVEPSQVGVHVGASLVHMTPHVRAPFRPAAALTLDGHYLLHGFLGVSMGLGAGVSFAPRFGRLSLRGIVGTQGRERVHGLFRLTGGTSYGVHWGVGDVDELVTLDGQVIGGVGIRVRPERTLELAVVGSVRSPRRKVDGGPPPLAASSLGVQVGLAFGGGRPTPLSTQELP